MFYLHHQKRVRPRHGISTWALGLLLLQGLPVSEQRPKYVASHPSVDASLLNSDLLIDPSASSYTSNKPGAKPTSNHLAFLEDFTMVADPTIQPNEQNNPEAFIKPTITDKKKVSQGQKKEKPRLKTWKESQEEEVHRATLLSDIALLLGIQGLRAVEGLFLLPKDRFFPPSKPLPGDLDELCLAFGIEDDRKTRVLRYIRKDPKIGAWLRPKELILFRQTMSGRAKPDEAALKAYLESDPIESINLIAKAIEKAGGSKEQRLMVNKILDVEEEEVQRRVDRFRSSFDGKTEEDLEILKGRAEALLDTKAKKDLLKKLMDHYLRCMEINFHYLMKARRLAVYQKMEESAGGPGWQTMMFEKRVESLHTGQAYDYRRLIPTKYSEWPNGPSILHDLEMEVLSRLNGADGIPAIGEPEPAIKERTMASYLSDGFSLKLGKAKPAETGPGVSEQRERIMRGNPIISLAQEMTYIFSSGIPSVRADGTNVNRPSSLRFSGNLLRNMLKALQASGSGMTQKKAPVPTGSRVETTGPKKRLEEHIRAKPRRGHPPSAVPPHEQE